MESVHDGPWSIVDGRWSMIDKLFFRYSGRIRLFQYAVHKEKPPSAGHYFTPRFRPPVDRGPFVNRFSG
jgi:hypothetical protein